MIFLIPGIVSMFSTSALAFSNRSAPPASTTLTRNAQQQQQQQQQEPSSQAHAQSLSSRSQGSVGHEQSGLSERPTRRESALAFSPADIGGAATLISMKVNAVRGASAALSGGPTQLLTDASYVVMDPNKFFPDVKVSKLRMQHAQVFGRLMVLGTTFLPHHGVHPEELAVQLFLLSVSMKPIIRSVQLYKCITSNKGECEAECALEFEELEAALHIHTPAIQPAAIAV
eukprot:CAMPEP_0170848876 /NCGR_PEP_ID=MMETSP0734-20130129/9647_1 /TAXON_ID=186038 /ORGANISM="Fragilariopsis kerguelensis, Strain L26-C5" /LENGTH=228 /DNA_ID=CAMNT_0011218385 /DNA_START=65 /DNA_END=751 /DNA_ORIENTATION=-